MSDSTMTPEQHRRAAQRRGIAPGWKRGCRGLDGRCGLCSRGERDPRGHLAGGRIEDITEAIAGPGDVRAVDEVGQRSAHAGFLCHEGLVYRYRAARPGRQRPAVGLKFPAGATDRRGHQR